MFTHSKHWLLLPDLSAMSHFRVHPIWVSYVIFREEFSAHPSTRGVNKLHLKCQPCSETYSVAGYDEGHAVGRG